MKKRFYLIDGIRGLAIVNMVLFHFLYDVFILYGRQPDWYDRTGTFLWQQGICWTFILISGMVWHFGKKGSLKRGLLLNFWGLVISAVTCVAEPQAAVWFGILNFIGCAVLLMIPLDRIFRRFPPVAGIVVSMVLFSFSGCAEWCAGAGFSSAGCAAGWAVSVESSDVVWVSISGVSVQ